MKSTLYLLVILLSISITKQITATERPLSGQAKIDSLTKVLKKAKIDTNQVMLLNKLAGLYIDINPEKAIEYSNNALKLAQKMDWLKGEVDSYNMIGVSYTYSTFDSKKGLDYSLKALKIAEELNNSLTISYSLRSLGELYLESTRDSIRKKIESVEANTEFLNKEINLNKSIDFNKKAESVCLEVGDINSLVFVYRDLYLAYYEKDDTDKALRYFQE
jgi:tetratricopeptide (TPR) repeat protein